MDLNELPLDKLSEQKQKKHKGKGRCVDAFGGEEVIIRLMGNRPRVGRKIY